MTDTHVHTVTDLVLALAFVRLDIKPIDSKLVALREKETRILQKLQELMAENGIKTVDDCGLHITTAETLVISPQNS